MPELTSDVSALHLLTWQTCRDQATAPRSVDVGVESERWIMVRTISTSSIAHETQDTWPTLREQELAFSLVGIVIR